MAPPHITKKTSATTSETVRRNGHHHDEHRKRVIEEERISSSNKSDGDSEMQDVYNQNDQGDALNSQQVEVNMGGRFKKMFDDQRKRYGKEKAVIVDEYERSRKDAEEGIKTLLGEWEKKSSSADTAQLNILCRLLEKKVEYEKRIASKLTTLEAGYAAHCRDLQRVAEHRANALN
ncbi:hypothetical protein K504DRAFT_533416 [Pleomassaria siparia CBS 279.74]|uniref:Uncharacterized protein n=1 Tax=Pleomassaria siparia CBS 279.74 TaxID=1314801 RepID=A0A6G1KDF6_9PLEO|nr:hypothetical protein K504DRAFT_533416 [Pleomassaria siparia CBS 279.74]